LRRAERFRFSGLGFVTDVQRKKNGRDREVEYVTVEASR
jgi:hypothetical protein